MHAEITPELLEAIGQILKKLESAVGEPVEGLIISMPRICDECQDPGKEAFPNIFSSDYQHLCNDCTELLYFGEEYYA